MFAQDLPSASSSPAPSIARIERRSDGVAVITLDDRAGVHNTITPAFGGELSAALDTALADPNVHAVVLRSGKKASFIAGADIGLVRSIRFAQDAEDGARELARRFARIASAVKPVVAYVHGPALGGGFELALACAATVASDDPCTVLGLPEVKLGLLPAANGLLRVAERAGIRVALDLGTTGKSLGPTEARRLGLIDDVVPTASGLETAAALALRLAKEPAFARSLTKKRMRSKGLARAARLLLEKNPIGRFALFRKARTETLGETRGHYPAPERIVDVLARYGSRGFDAAAELEPRVFGDLVVSETAHRLMDLFFARSSLKKDSGLEPGEKAAPFEVERIAVLGAGLMGAGITAVSAQAGLSVRMKDTDDVAVRRGLRWVEDLFDGRARRGSISPLERDVAFSRVSGGVDLAGAGDADLVIEAVFEDLELKQAVIRDVEARVRPTCVIASNTAALPITRLAEGAARPEMIVGMHYPRPAHRMSLLEVVQTKHADPRAIATAVAVGRRQGKTVIVVRDGAAFYTSRILVPYLEEAMRLLGEGASIDAVDTAMVDWGFQVGPFQLMDQVGIDLADRVMQVTHAAFGDRLRPPPAFARLRGDDRRGKRNARGFYLHGSAAPRRKTVDATVYPLLGVTPTPRAVPADEIALRCGLAMINEALRCHDDVVRSARDGDIGAIFGVGFPSFRGGPFRHVDVLGAPEILRRMRSLEQRFGERFEPAPLLVEAARSGKRFYG
jgi:3-hydroxyacyl-CoA dehydrogenase / enoyl-CoA hydratase / 3-hydroxybutyryl-CoA epimerase